MHIAKRYKKLYNDTAAGTGGWVRLDGRYAPIINSEVQATVASGDTLALQATSVDVKGIDETYLTNLLASDITTLNTFSSSGNYVINGNYTWVRVVKTGTAGLGVVEGFI